MAKANENRMERVSTGVVLEEIREWERQNPDLFQPMSDAEYSKAMARDERRQALLDLAAERRVPLGLVEALQDDLDALEEIVRTRPGRPRPAG